MHIDFDYEKVPSYDSIEYIYGLKFRKGLIV
jgi:hypothetical protein